MSRTPEEFFFMPIARHQMVLLFFPLFSGNLHLSTIAEETKERAELQKARKRGEGCARTSQMWTPRNTGKRPKSPLVYSGESKKSQKKQERRRRLCSVSQMSPRHQRQRPHGLADDPALQKYPPAYKNRSNKQKKSKRKKEIETEFRKVLPSPLRTRCQYKNTERNRR
ncbi:hypothetical protein K402DRAFT_94880 [Aulographum hederae CBS 113979]|uniref:Uncharacterized protein n=1 Tax=Aulographum hederae CBS 113979 TaxID=1176131 RepID=A0A6G1GYP9_9PEZI|nr:hypothetical protein K402DRAFT_94880 [Aulographum hederae CBS 113979]